MLALNLAQSRLGSKIAIYLRMMSVKSSRQVKAGADLPPLKKPQVVCHHGPTNTFIITTPIGELALECCPKGIHQLTAHDTPTDDYFTPDTGIAVEIKEQLYEDNGYTYKPSAECTHWLRQYFQTPAACPPLPSVCHLNQQNGRFHQKVWQTLADEVGFGKTVSYGELATLCGNKKAAQAVGQAMRSNPVMILVPCHRVILSSGNLGNYSGGRRNKVKHWLLEHEQQA